MDCQGDGASARTSTGIAAAAKAFFGDAFLVGIFLGFGGTAFLTGTAFATFFTFLVFFALALGAAFARPFTSPSSFLMFCTLGSEIPTLSAICEPVLPAPTSFFTRARVASVIFARLPRLVTFAAFGGLLRFVSTASLRSGARDRT